MIEQRDLHRQILALTRQISIEINRAPIPDKMAFNYPHVMTCKANGPRWKCRKWFGNAATTPAFRKRAVRAIEDLEAEGLVIVFKGFTHINLTKKGWRVARKIAAENELLEAGKTLPA